MKAKEVKCEKCGGNGRLSTPITKGAPEGGSMECRACNGMGRVEAKEADDLKEAAYTIEDLSEKLSLCEDVNVIDELQKAQRDSDKYWELYQNEKEKLAKSEQIATAVEVGLNDVIKHLFEKLADEKGGK